MENKNIIYYKQLDSTNIKLAQLSKEGAAHGTVVVADEQTAGKGRRGRTWESPAGENIYMSVLLRPQIDVDKAPMITMVMAYSIAKVLQQRGYFEVQIKWPNDLILSGKKVCGILTEMHMAQEKIEDVIVGVGMNVNTKAFPEELTEKATSLYLENNRKVERKGLIEDIVGCFEENYQMFAETGNLSFLQEEYNTMLVNCEREVRVMEPGKEYTAYAQGINERGELLVKRADGSEEAIFAGEVSVRGIYGYV